jgi:hypothetical protein
MLTDSLTTPSALALILLITTSKAGTIERRVAVAGYTFCGASGKTLLTDFSADASAPPSLPPLPPPNDRPYDSNTYNSTFQLS